MLRISGFFLLFCCIAQASVIAAECELRLEVANVEWRGGTLGGYDVFDPGEYPQTVYFKVRLIGDPCPFFVTFSRGIQGDENRLATFAGETLQYEVYASIDNRTILKELPGASGDEVITGSFAPGQTEQELSYAIVVPPLQVTPSGYYTDSMQITVYQGTPEDFIERDSHTINFTIPVEDVTELSLVGYGAPFDPHAKVRELDFGKLSRGKSMGFDLRVRSNIGYRIILESENSGVMRNVDPAVSTSVPYSLELGGVAVNFVEGQPVELSRGSRLTDREGEPHGFQVTIGETAGAAAGTYRDNISITVISRE